MSVCVLRENCSRGTWRAIWRRCWWRRNQGGIAGASCGITAGLSRWRKSDAFSASRARCISGKSWNRACIFRRDRQSERSSSRVGHEDAASDCSQFCKNSHLRLSRDKIWNQIFCFFFISFFGTSWTKLSTNKLCQIRGSSRDKNWSNSVFLFNFLDKVKKKNYLWKNNSTSYQFYKNTHFGVSTTRTFER